jgi:7-cyano-7-deazaguanine reductase
VSAGHDKGPLLGRQVSGSGHYDPSLLFPVPRANARNALPGGGFDGYGEDLWQCYELSWLDSEGCPRVFMGLLSVPADSASLVESKSLKLYLNSLNNHPFESDEAARGCIETDLSAVAGAAVSLSLHPVQSEVMRAQPLPGESLDTLAVKPAAAPTTALLAAAEEGELQVFTHAMRSLCPVTAQPDWATVIVHLQGSLPSREGLLSYLLAFRDHQEFHEQCVERIFVDLRRMLVPHYLSVQALYTRRGGLAICPWRCSEDSPAPRLRLDRQ